MAGITPIYDYDFHVCPASIGRGLRARQDEMAVIMLGFAHTIYFARLSMYSYIKK